MYQDGTTGLLVQHHSEEAPASLPSRTVLLQNYPNPFNPTTTITYSLAKASHVRLSIHDVRGTLVRTLVDGFRSRTTHSVTWDGTDVHGAPVATGVYWYRIEAGSFQQTRKMVLVK